MAIEDETRDFARKVFVDGGLAFLEDVEMTYDEKEKALEKIYSKSVFMIEYFGYDPETGADGVLPMGLTTNGGRILRELYRQGMKGRVIKTRDEVEGLVKIAETSETGCIDDHISGILQLYDLPLKDKEKLFHFGARYIKCGDWRYNDQNNDRWKRLREEAMNRNVTSVEELEKLSAEIK